MKRSSRPSAFGSRLGLGLLLALGAARALAVEPHLDAATAERFAKLAFACIRPEETFRR
jgi:hypothetical protein